MTIYHALRASLGLLSRRDQRALVFVSLAQMSTAFLDLIGVLLIGVVMALSVAAVSDVPIPSLIESVLESFGLSEVNPLTLAAYLGLTAGIVLIGKSAINVALTRRVLRFLANRQGVVAGRLAAALLARPLLQVLRRSSQETVYALTGGTNAATLTMLSQAVVAVSELALLIVLALGLAVISPLVTFFTIIFFALIALVLQRVLSRWAGRLGEQGSITEIAALQTIQEALQTYREVFVTNRRLFYVERFQELRWQTSRIQSDLAFINQIPKYVFEVALIFGAGILALSQLLTKDLSAALSIIAVFLVAGSRVVPSMLRLQTAGIVMHNAAGLALPTYQLADELLFEDQSPQAFHCADSIRKAPWNWQMNSEFSPSIRVVDVSVAYPGSSQLTLDNVSFELSAGSSLALVGTTGAGKSTLADVILGIMLPDQGHVYIGGEHPLHAIERWPGSIAYVPQEVAMTNGNVRENVALGLPEDLVDDEWVWEALDRAHLSNFLRGHREGLDTIVGESGLRLSGGQRQRLGVARALYTHPKLLVLDEATSALDAETEKSIALTLQELEGQVTTVTIAHRLATIRHCDLILYLEEGRILASGAFTEVREKSANFDRQARLLGL